MGGDYCGQRWTTWFTWNEGVKPFDTQRRIPAICGEKAPAQSTVFNCVRSLNGGKETAQTAV
jgi:hypothetical protein